MAQKRLALALVVAVSIVLLALVASVWLLSTAERGDAAEVSAQLLRREYERAATMSRKQLQHSCESDVDVERLALELEAGGEPSASGVSRRLGALLGGELFVLTSEGARVQQVAGGDALSPLPSRRSLERVREQPRVLAESVVQSCQRKLGQGELWLLSSEPLAQLKARLTPMGGELELRRLSRAHDIESAEGTGEVLRIDDLEDQHTFVLTLRAAGSAHLETLLALLPLALALLLAAGASVYLVSRHAPVDERVLEELEQAATRVAQGDLTRRITTRLGGRADQTFNTFDHMTKELADMRTKLSESERAAAWQDMAQRIAHEIKNPLSPIQMALETLRKAHEKRLESFDEIFEESTRAMLEEVRRIEHIVREFSEFARLPKPRPGALDLRTLLDDTLALYQSEDLPFSVEHLASELAVRADREQITQVLVNLLQNARDAALGSVEPRICVRSERDPRRVYVHVEDSGQGIARDARERVFEPYFTTKQHGTGLGLAIARRIALDHGGTLEVGDSALGGARFTLALPRADVG